MNSEIEKLIVDILIKEMEIDSSRVIIGNQNFKIPKDDGLYITATFVDSVTIANNNYTEDVPDGGLTEVQETYLRENIQIDLFSRDNEARQRRSEIQMALKSIYAQQLQEKENFRIFRVPSSFMNTSEAEGSSRINRFTIIIPCNTWYRKKKSASYYDRFPARVDDEATIGGDNGLIEFEINSEE